jgi:hypothetical protein
MPILVTIVLDSGAFLQNIDEDPSELDVGYFQSGKDHAGNDVPDIRAYADAEEAPVRHNKLGQGRINVIRTKGGAPVAGIKISDSLKRNLLRKVELYGEPSPDYDKRAIECVIHFTSGNFRCSKVKNRRFVEVLVKGYSKTGNEKHIRPIAHDVLVHFLLADDEELRLERQNGPVLFSTRNLKTGTKHVEIELLTNNATAEQFFCDALDLTGRTHCWLPNQGDPTSTGTP